MPQCPSCQATQSVKNGLTRHGKQNYRCKTCGRQFTEHPTQKIIPLETRSLIDRLLLERLSLAGIARAVHVSETWLQHYVNHKLESVNQTITAPQKKGT